MVKSKLLAVSLVQILPILRKVHQILTKGVVLVNVLTQNNILNKLKTQKKRICELP